MVFRFLYRTSPLIQALGGVDIQFMVGFVQKLCQTFAGYPVMRPFGDEEYGSIGF